MKLKKTHKKKKKNNHQKGGLEPGSMIIGGVAVGTAYFLYKLIKKLREKKGRNVKQAISFIKQNIDPTTGLGPGGTEVGDGDGDGSKIPPEDRETDEERRSRLIGIQKDLNEFYSKYKYQDDISKVAKYILGEDITKLIADQDKEPGKCHDFSPGTKIMIPFFPEMLDKLAKVDPINSALLSLDYNSLLKENSKFNIATLRGYLNQRGGRPSDELSINYSEIKNISEKLSSNGGEFENWRELFFYNRDEGDIFKYLNMIDNDDETLKELLNKIGSLNDLRYHIPIIFTSVVSNVEKLNLNCSNYNLSYQNVSDGVSCYQDLGNSLENIGNSVGNTPQSQGTQSSSVTSVTAAASKSGSTDRSPPPATPTPAGVTIIPGISSDKLKDGSEILYWKQSESNWNKGTIKNINKQRKTVNIEGESQPFAIDDNKLDLFEGQGGGGGPLTYIKFNYLNNRSIKIPIHEKEAYKSALVEEQLSLNYDQTYLGRCFVYKILDADIKKMKTYNEKLLNEIYDEIKSLSSKLDLKIDIESLDSVEKAEKLIRLLQTMYYLELQKKILFDQTPENLNHTNIISNIDTHLKGKGIDLKEILQKLKLQSNAKLENLNKRMKEMHDIIKDGDDTDHIEGKIKKHQTNLQFGNSNISSGSLEQLMSRFSKLTQDKLLVKNIKEYFHNDPFTDNIRKLLYQIDNTNLISPFCPNILYDLYYYITTENIIGDISKSIQEFSGSKVNEISILNQLSDDLVNISSELSDLPAMEDDVTSRIFDYFDKIFKNIDKVHTFIEQFGIFLKSDNFQRKAQVLEEEGRLNPKTVYAICFIYIIYRTDTTVLNIFPLLQNLENKILSESNVMKEYDTYNIRVKHLYITRAWLNVELHLLGIIYHATIEQIPQSVRDLRKIAEESEGEMKKLFRDAGIQCVQFYIILSYIKLGYLVNEDVIIIKGRRADDSVEYMNEFLYEVNDILFPISPFINAAKQNNAIFVNDEAEERFYSKGIIPFSHEFLQFLKDKKNLSDILEYIVYCCADASDGQNYNAELQRERQAINFNPSVGSNVAERSGLRLVPAQSPSQPVPVDPALSAQVLSPSSAQKAGQEFDPPAPRHPPSDSTALAFSSGQKSLGARSAQPPVRAAAAPVRAAQQAVRIATRPQPPPVPRALAADVAEGPVIGEGGDAEGRQLQQLQQQLAAALGRADAMDSQIVELRKRSQPTAGKLPGTGGGNKTRKKIKRKRRRRTFKR